MNYTPKSRVHKGMFFKVIGEIVILTTATVS